jgi:hypothetical protein
MSVYRTSREFYLLFRRAGLSTLKSKLFPLSIMAVMKNDNSIDHEKDVHELKHEDGETT